MMAAVPGPGRVYDPEAGTWPDPPRPWLTDKPIVAAKQVMDAAQADYDRATDRWLDVARRIAQLQFAATAGPDLVPVDYSTIHAAANSATAMARQLEDTDLLAAREHRDRAHQRWLETRDDYERLVADARRRHRGW